MAVLFCKVRGFFCPGMLALAMTLAGQMPARSQGSIGGTIGVTDKALSGSRSAPPQERRPKADSPEKGGALPDTIMITDHAGLTYSIVLHKRGKNTYGGTWSHGYVTTFTVTKFTTDSLNMIREDKPAFGSVTGTYAAHRSGNSAHGNATVSNGAASTWDATW